ncbi:MAG: cellulase family glycosylhydrolase [Fibrobacteraceae bacterium]|nr:cellulase family glycosylhydrolase [Fibrobacteraceae bacterium]
MKKVCLFVLVCFAFAASRVGPVSAYGQLQAGKNSSGKGQIYGSCKGVSSGNEVQVQGMSLFWSIADDVGAPFWTADYVSGLVSRQNIQIIRAAMGVDEDWGAGNYFTNTSRYQGLMNTVVQAAIDNDIYVIIDYHSHKANENVNNAKTFFKYMAEKWGKYDNVIFEIFNEPTSQDWSTIKNYADQVISTIRQYSDNLIVVGNRSWDQYPNEAASNPINDKNVAYTFHFYAGTHSTGKEGANAVSAMNSGLSVFVSEWGTVNADGGGSVSGNSSTWLNWMNDHKLSGANWSVSNKNEGASYFNGSAWNYSESGNWVNTNIFSKLPKSYTACSGTPIQSSSSVAQSSSSALPSGKTNYIDDFEDGDNYAYTGGEWYAYTDAGDKGASSFNNKPNDKDGYDVVLAGSTSGNSTKYVAGLTGVKLSKGENKYDPYVALGVGLNAAQTAYDLSSCNTISYKYKGAAHNFKAEDTNVKDYGYHQITKLASSSWTAVNISWDMLIQESWAEEVTLSKKRINKLTWEIKGEQPSLNYLYIDDVRCDGMAITPVPSPSSSSSSVKPSSSSSSKPVSSSSSKPVSSSSSKPISSSSSNPVIWPSSSSQVQPQSSSSVVVATPDWESNTQLQENQDGSITIGQSNDYASERVITKVLGNIDAGNSYVLSFDIAMPYGNSSMDVSVGFASYCNDVVTVQSGGSESYKCEFTASTSTSSAALELKMEGNRWEQLTLSNLSLTTSNGAPVTPDQPSAIGNFRPQVSSIQITLNSRTLAIAGGIATVEIFDMQGRPLRVFRQVSGSVSLESLQAGAYIVRAYSNSNVVTKRLQIR